MTSRSDYFVARKDKKFSGIGTVVKSISARCRLKRFDFTRDITLAINRDVTLKKKITSRYIAAESYDRWSFFRLFVKYLRYFENTIANGVIIRAHFESVNLHCTMRNSYFNRQRSQNSESHRISIRNDNVGLCGVNTRYTLDTKKFTKNSEGEREKARGTEAE